jgi:hypothetical protein
MEKTSRVVFAGVLLSFALLGPSQAQNRDIDGDVRARNGTIRCGGSNFIRQSGTEIHFTFYNLRNVSATTPITIERLTFFDASGAVLFDSDASGFPAFRNGVLGPSDNVLDPNQTAQLDTADVLPFLPEDRRPIQLEIVWSAPERVLILDAGHVRVGRGRDPATGAQGQDRTRHSGGCRTIRLSR